MFYTFVQNNINVKHHSIRGVSAVVIIEATSLPEAKWRAHQKGMYVDECTTDWEWAEHDVQRILHVPTDKITYVHYEDGHIALHVPQHLK